MVSKEQLDKFIVSCQHMVRQLRGFTHVPVELVRATFQTKETPLIAPHRELTLLTRTNLQGQ